MITFYNYIFNIIYDSEKRITPQKSVIMLFDTHLKIKFTKHKNKILDYYSISYKLFFNRL